MRKHNQQQWQTNTLRKIYLSHFIRKGCESVVCERWVGDWTDCNILTPSSSDYSSTSFSFWWAAQPGVLRAQAPCWKLILIPSNCNSNTNKLTPTLVPGYIIVWHPPASCGRRICTEFNPSTCQGDIFDRIHLFLDWRLRRRSVCYKNTEKSPGHLKRLAVTWTTVRDYQLMMVWKTLKKWYKVKVKLATLVEGDPKAPFSIATTPMCRGRRYSFPQIAPLYPRSLPYIAEC